MATQRVSEVVKPALLRWARETAGLTREEAAQKIGVKPERLAGWEAEPAWRPTVVQLRKASHVYRRPLAVFFLPAPPAQPAPLHDFRRLPADAATRSSPELLLEMRRARRRRAVALELLEDLGRPHPEFPLRAALDDDAEEMAQRARAWLQVPLEMQTRWTADYDALNGWLAALEARGILVFQTGEVPIGEMRGFSLNEHILPVIVLNAKDAPRGRVFTLMHELTHVMLSRGGVCDPLLVGRQARTADERVEMYCNRVAGAILVPRDTLLTHPSVAATRGPREWPDDTLKQLAEQFAVSREVILRRMVILGRATDDFYERKRAEYLARYRQLAEQAREREGFPPFYRILVRDNGREYTRLVLEAFDRQRITAADVSDYLGTSLKHLGDIAGAVERVGVRG